MVVPNKWLFDRIPSAILRISLNHFLMPESLTIEHFVLVDSLARPDWSQCRYIGGRLQHHTQGLACEKCGYKANENLRGLLTRRIPGFLSQLEDKRILACIDEQDAYTMYWCFILLYCNQVV